MQEINYYVLVVTSTYFTFRQHPGRCQKRDHHEENKTTKNHFSVEALNGHPAPMSAAYQPPTTPPDNNDDDRLANDLHATFAGQDKSIEDLELFVLTKTPAVNFKTALAKLLDTNKLAHVTGHARKKDFSNAKSVVRFIANPVATSLFG